MSGYAPNATAPSDGGGEASAGGFLARKGEALPAVDAQAHAGVDVETYAQHPTGAGMKAGHKRKSKTKQDFASLYRVPRRNRIAASGDADLRRGAVTITPPTAKEAWFAKRQRKRVTFDKNTMRAVVTFRMPVTDFIRLRRAAKSLEMTCQAILNDATDCYLEANDIPVVSKEEATQEAAAMAKRRKVTQAQQE